MNYEQAIACSYHCCHHHHNIYLCVLYKLHENIFIKFSRFGRPKEKVLTEFLAQRPDFRVSEKKKKYFVEYEREANYRE